MSDDSIDAPQVLAGQHLLDDLELIRQGVHVPLSSVGVDMDLSVNPGPSLHVVLIEPEGVPVASATVRPNDDAPSRFCLDDPLRYLGQRPVRPFEDLHRRVRDVGPPVVTLIVDHAIEPGEMARHLPAVGTMLVLVVASVEGRGEADDAEIEVCRQTRHSCRSLAARGNVSLEMAIAPVARDHPYRQMRIDACSSSYRGDGRVIDLTRTGVVSDETNQSPREGGVLFFTGLSGSGKSTLARAVRNRIVEETDRQATLLDGDVVRRHLSSGLGFSAEDRDRNVKRIGWVASLIATHGGLAICSPIAPFDTTRGAVREMTTRTGARFMLVHVSTPLEECERRDRKGLYARARRGEIPDFTGISSPYEEPLDAELVLDTTDQDIPSLVTRVLDVGRSHNLCPSIPNDE